MGFRKFPKTIIFHERFGRVKTIRAKLSKKGGSTNPSLIGDRLRLRKASVQLITLSVEDGIILEPTDFLNCSITPIIKDNEGDASSPDNYRGISISVMFAQLFERALLLKFNDFLITDDLQFGFKLSNIRLLM